MMNIISKVANILLFMAVLYIQLTHMNALFFLLSEFGPLRYVRQLKKICKIEQEERASVPHFSVV